MKNLIQRLLPVVVLFALGTVLMLYLVPSELAQMNWELSGMPEDYPLAQKFRPLLLTLLCYLPFIGSLMYACMGTIDRYMTRNFISYFLMCTLILLLIYILADFTDNMERFRTRFENPVLQALKFYGSQMPMFLYQILPYTLMMGTMWCLSKLSGTCEITGMMQSGRSLMRLCLPIFLMGALVSVSYGIFGYHWAPNGMMYRQMQLKQERREDGSSAAVLYRSESNNRHWLVNRPATIDNPGAPMCDVQIFQFSEGSSGKADKEYYAEKAIWNKAESTWTLYNVNIYTPPSIEQEINEKPAEPVKYDKLVCNFDEKPYQIISPGPGGRIDAMGTAEIYEYIQANAGTREDRYKMRTEWHVRIARIFTCLVLVLLASPSSVTFQRRGTMKGIGIAIILAALMLFLYRVFPALGEAGVIQAWISAWIPNVIYTIIAIYIFRKNLAHRSFKEWLQARMKGDI